MTTTAPEAPTAPPAGDPAPQPPAPTPPTPPQPPAQPAGEVKVGDDDTVASLAEKHTPAELAAYALRLRNEAKRGRTEAKATAAETARTELVQQLAREAGLLPADGGKVTPEQLTAELQQSKTETATAKAAARDALVQLALYETAAQHGATPGQLLSLVVLRDTSQLDPEAADFRDKVVAAAQAAAEANPVLKSAPVAARSGAEFTGRSGAPQTPSNLEEAIAAKQAAMASS